VHEVGKALEELRLGATTVLFGPQAGKYPDGNSLVVEGADTRVLIDPSLGVRVRVERKDPLLDGIDRVLLSHCHEDHIAGLDLFQALPDEAVAVHAADAHGLQSLDRMLDIYGFPGEVGDSFRESLVDDFHYAPRPGAATFEDAALFELGGGVRIRAIHTPGHTRGHTCFWVEDPAAAPTVYLGDIDLSGFGPYYGDAWSDLEDFERSLERVAEFEKLGARHFATFHHIGVLEGEAFRERFTRFAAVIPQREERLLRFLDEARSLEEIAREHFIYRPESAPGFAHSVELRSMGMHLDRLEAQGRVVASSGPDASKRYTATAEAGAG